MCRLCNKSEPGRPSTILRISLSCAESPDTAFVHARASSGRWLRRHCSPRSPSAAPTRSATRTARPARPIRRSSSSARRRRSCSSASRVPQSREPAARARPRLHQGASVDHRQQPPRPARAGRRDPQRDHPNDDELLAPHSCARAEPRMTVDSEAIFAIAAHSRNDARALEQPARRDGDRLARRARARTRSSSPAAPAGRCGSARAARACSSPRPSARSRSSSATAGCSCASARCARGRCSPSPAASVVRRERFRPDLEYVEDNPLPSVRAPQERDFCLQPARAVARRDLAVRPSRRAPTVAPSSSRRSRIRNWNVPHAPRRDSNMR